MLQGTDRIADFPSTLNRLENQVEELSKNTRGIKVAIWVTAISTTVLAITGLISLINTLLK